MGSAHTVEALTDKARTPPRNAALAGAHRGSVGDHGGADPLSW